MSDPETTLDNMYLEWLYTNYVGAVSNRNPRSSYWELSKQLYTMKFTWVIQDDENRAERGKELRKHFIDECDIQDIEINWLQIEEVSVLEVLISLACRASFETWGEPGDWFWKFLENLELNGYNDNVYSQAIMQEVDAVVRRWLDREYEKDGVGGLFPRQNATQDQTKLNIWYQMQGYLLEGNYLEHGP